MLYFYVNYVYEAQEMEREPRADRVLGLLSGCARSWQDLKKLTT